MRQKRFLILIPAVLLLVGCAGIKPAVKQTPPNVLKRVEGEKKTEPAKPTGESQPATGETQEAEPAQGTAGAEKAYPAPTPVDDLELPQTAMPLAADSLQQTELPSQPQSEMPPELENGWKVQVLSLTDRKMVNNAYTDLKLHHGGIPMHLRYVEDRYVLLVGGYKSRAKADSLRDLLHEQGYPDAFVVEAPVVADSTKVGAADSPSDSGAVETPGVSTDGTTVSSTPGWRIQVMSLGSRTAAEQEKNKAEGRIGRPVYIVEADGMYKLRVGDFTDESEARLEAQRLGTMGYPGAFLVEETVNVSNEGASKE